MNHFNSENLKRLATIDEDVCISLYMPTDPAMVDNTDRIRFKNLIARAEKIVHERFSKNKSVGEMLDKIRTLSGDEGFWREQSDGLAVFSTPENFWHYRLPMQFEETLSVTSRPLIKPLIPLVMADDRFYVLALSLSGVRLLDCTRQRAVPVDLPEVPDGVDEALKYDEKHYQLQFHTGTASGGQSRPAMFHGQGVGVDDRKDDILRYFQKVDKGLPADLIATVAPLVLAGVDYLLPIFREACSHPWMLDDFVIGNPEGLSADDLHARALPIVQPVLEAKQRDAKARYREQAGLGRTASGVETVVPAAAFGRVDTLFVAIDERRPGKFDRKAGRVVRMESGTDGMEDLLDLAAAETIRNGGSVYAVPRVELPDDNAATVALLRY